MEGRGNTPGKLFLKPLGIPSFSILWVEQQESYFLFAVGRNGLMVSMEGLAGAGCCGRNYENRLDGPQVVATLAGRREEGCEGAPQPGLV